MKIPLVFFSASGNTEYICKIVNKGMKRQDIILKEIPVQTVKNDPLDFDKISVLGIASPIYEFNFARVIRNWIKTIPVTESPKKVFFIDTSGGAPGDAIRMAEEIMKKKNYHSIGALEIAIPTLEPFFSNRWYPVVWKEATLNRAYYFGLSIGRKILKDQEKYVDFTIRLPGIGILTKLMKWMESSPSGNLARSGELIGYRASKCRRCLKCENMCPMGAIKIDRKQPLDPQECMFCATCVRMCPQGAFYIKYRSNAVLPKKEEGPMTIKGYVTPDSFVPASKFILSKSIFDLF
jgi:ferredoxin/flavodoxin